MSRAAVRGGWASPSATPPPGCFLGQGILLALLHRERTGEGQWVHTSLLEAMLCKLDFQGARYTMGGEVPEQQGNDHPYQTPMGAFLASDGLVNIAAPSQRLWSASGRRWGPMSCSTGLSIAGLGSASG